MKTLTFILMCSLGMSNVSFAEDQQEQKAALLASKLLGVQQITKQVRFINACKEQNSKGMTLEQIKALDKEWQNSGSDTELKRSMSESQLGLFLKNLIENNADKYNEVFFTDAQGANIAAYPLTSDYWQGDEAKFTEAYAGGKGKIYIGDVEYDESTKVEAVQISAPIYYNKEVIGVFIMGVKIDHLVAEKLRGN